MKGTLLYGPRDIRFEEREDPKIICPTDAIIHLAVTSVCDSDLWPYRGINPVQQPSPMGHEYCGFVEEVGRGFRSVKPGQFVIGSFFASDNTCPHCQHGAKGICCGRAGALPTSAAADGTLVALPEVPPKDLFASFQAASDVFGTGWFAAEAAMCNRA